MRDHITSAMANVSIPVVTRTISLLCIMEGIPQEEKVKEKEMEKETKETATEISLNLESCMLLNLCNNRQKELFSVYPELMVLVLALLIHLVPHLPHLHPPDPLLALLRLRQAMETHDDRALAAPLASVDAALYPLHGRTARTR